MDTIKKNTRQVIRFSRNPPEIRLTLRWRLTLLYATLMVFLLAVISISAYATLRTNLSATLARDMDKTLEQLELKVRAEAFPSLDDFDAGGLSQVDRIIVLPLTRESLKISSGNASLIRQSSKIIISEKAYALLDATGNYRGREEVTLGDKVVPLFVQARYIPNVPVTDASGISYPVVIYVARDLRALDTTLEELQTILILLSLSGIVLSAVGSYSVAGNALEPIRKVRNTASEITGKSLSSRVPASETNDEVGDLAQAFNSMLDRLENSFETQKRFTADASHELRTPVTAISGHASFLLRRTNPTADQKESLEAIRSLTVRLSKLIGDLLDLARADAGFPVQPQEVNLVTLAEDVHLELAAIAGNAEIEVSGGRNLIVSADPNRIKQVILNLVQNAIKAGSTHIHVTVSLAKSNEQLVCLSVHDNGPGIAAEHVPKLFERFYRVDTARDRAVGGSGLGLSIVKWIVEAHSGTVTVLSEVGVGTRFNVHLPLVRIGKPENANVGLLEDRA